MTSHVTGVMYKTQFISTLASAYEHQIEIRKHARTNIALYIHVRTGEKRIMQIMIETERKRNVVHGQFRCKIMLLFNVSKNSARHIQKHTGQDNRHDLNFNTNKKGHDAKR